ncbi:putative transporter mch1 [Talaromyces pinophilus]|nr:putative transporter mch1 [Talaromyces pinophilus]
MPANNEQIKIDKRDFDANRPLLADHASADEESGASDGPRISRLSADSDDSDRPGEGLLSVVVENIVERDRAKMRREVMRITSFVWSVLSCLGAGSITAFSLYGPLLLTRLQYSQDRVNGIAVAAEVAMYLPVSIFGYLCDRYSPSPVSLLAGILFGAGYLLAALSYKSGPPVDVGGSGWPYWVMVVAFVLIGMGTCCLYGAAVTTCAKNFGRGKYKGIMLAVPIAAFGLSGMWQSQIGSHVLCERLADGSCSEAVDVFRYFIFLAILLFVIGVGGTAALRIVDGEEQEKYIDEAVSELERSGILGEDGFFRPREEVRAAYGTFRNEGDNSDDLADDRSMTLSEEERAELRRQKEREEEERQKKNWLLNHETRLFFKDHTMWWLALGFFFVTGPGEAYINNLGTIIHSLTPVSYPLRSPPPAGSASTHVSTIAITSTIARLFVGSITDLFAPPATHQFIYSLDNPNRQPIPHPTDRGYKGITISRLTFLLPSALVLSLGFLILASPLILPHPGLFHLTTAFIGFGYGASFALMPIIISVVWGVENFGTNWGIVAMVPAAGAAFWGFVYSKAYQDALVPIDDGVRQGQCFGWRCFGFWAVGCMVSVWMAIVVWLIAWRGWKRRGVVV